MSKGFNILSLRTDKDAETKGRWVDAGAGLRLLVARVGNPEYQRYLSLLLKPLREEAGGVGQVDPEKVEKVTRKAMAKHVLLGWENLCVPKDGDAFAEEPELVQVPYSVQKAEEFLAISDFAEVVASYARSSETFRIKATETTKGNLPAA